MSSEKFCLKWNDFQQNIVSSYHKLRKESDFSDVTLVCEEDKQIEAHRIILIASSPLFSSILKRNKHFHPMIYLKGIKAKDLVAIVDFMYHGEATIPQDDMDGFLSLAEELQLKGLAGSEPETIDETKPPLSLNLSGRNILKQDIFINQSTSGKNLINSAVKFDHEKVVMNLDDWVMGDLQAQIDSMVERDVSGEYTCSICGKTTKGRDANRNIRKHVEIHIDGVAHPCNQCEKVSRSSHELEKLISRYHMQSFSPIKMF